jgi:hypothetical protein
MSKIVLQFICLWALQAASVVGSSFNLTFNEDDRLASHYLLYSPACSAEVVTRLKSSELHETMPIYPDLAQLVYGTVEVCTVARLVRGTERSVVQHVLPEKIHRETDGTPLDSWLHEHVSSVEVGFVNQGGDPTDLYWVSPSGERIEHGPLDVGEQHTKWIVSFLGHKFVLVNRVTGENVLEVTIEHDSFFAVGQPAPVVVKPEFLELLEDRVEATVVQEWHKSRAVSRTFTGLGFAKGRLPLDLWASLQAYYYNNQHRMMREEWGGKGLFVNWWEVDARMIGMPWGLKKYWQSRLKTLVEAWAGETLELTDIYGMRQYEEGARLLMHVDRVNTHAASLIINIAQHNMREPWLLQIYDFADRMHQVSMDPGDIVYYESARCLHGRMSPLNGSAYVNLFAHYQPMEGGKGDPNWYTKKNPPGTPAPILDFDDVCSIDETQAGAFQSCGGARAVGGEDIFRFWKDNGPAPK